MRYGTAPNTDRYLGFNGDVQRNAFRGTAQGRLG